MEVIHKSGCGGVAFAVIDPEEFFRPGRPITSKQVLLPDGTHPEPGSPMVCGTCGKSLGGDVELVRAEYLRGHG